MPDDRTLGLAAGMVEHLAKPIDIVGQRALLQDLLRRHAAARSLGDL